MAKRALALFWRFTAIATASLLALALLPPLLPLDLRLLGAGAGTDGPTASNPARPWPSNGEVVADLTPTLRWPSTEPGWTVHLFEERRNRQWVWVASIPAGEGRLELPEGLLEPDATYLWSVAAGVGDLVPVAFSGHFSTRQRVVSGPLSVAPAAFRIGLDTLLSGQELNVEAPAGGQVQVVLPEVLTIGGQRKLLVSGGFTARVEVSVRFSTVDAGMLTQGLGAIEVRLGAHQVFIPVEMDVSRLGMPEEVVQSGFDPVMDTPGFANFTRGTLSQLTRGTCLGMVLSAREQFRECVSCTRRPDCLCLRMRLKSLLQEERVREQMDFLHLANLEPRNWSIAVSTLSGGAEEPRLEARLMKRLGLGDPVPVAMLATTPTDPTQPETALGHAVLAYGAILFTDTIVVFTYDPDDVPGADQPLTSFLWSSRREDLGFRRPEAGGSVPVLAHLLPDTPLLVALPEGLTRTVAALDAELARRMEGK